MRAAMMPWIESGTPVRSRLSRGCPRSLPLLERTLLDEHREHLLDEERVSVGRLQDRTGDALRHGLGVEQCLAGALSDSVLPSGVSMSEEACDVPGAPRGSRVHQLGPRKADDQCRTVLQCTEDVVDEIEKWLGRPVNVLDDQHHQAVASERRQVVRPGLMERPPNIRPASEAARAIGQRETDRPRHAAQDL